MNLAQLQELCCVSGWKSLPRRYLWHYLAYCRSSQSFKRISKDSNGLSTI